MPSELWLVCMIWEPWSQVFQTAISANFLNGQVLLECCRNVGEVWMDQSEDRSFLSKLPKKRLLDLFYFQIRNIWRVDGLYFLGIEKEFGTSAASEIDAECWKAMGTLEARQLKEMLHTKEWSIPKVMEALKLTSWALDQRDKTVQVRKDEALFRVATCNTQLTRIRKGLTEFPCRPVREGYLRAFVQELNPSVTVACNICPPGAHSESVWCEWRFSRST